MVDVVVFFRFILTPIMLFLIMGWAWSLTGSGPKILAVYFGTSSRDTRRLYAFWLGILIALLAIIISQVTVGNPDFAVNTSQPFSLGGVGIFVNVVVGLGLGIAAMATSRLVGKYVQAAVLIAILSSASLFAAYHWLFDGYSRDVLLIASVSFVIGAIGFAVFDPNSVP